MYPPNKNQWPFEANGIRLRRALRLKADERLPVRKSFDLLQGVEIRGHGETWSAQSIIDAFRGEQRAFWSACAVPLSGGDVVVIYNDSHSPERIRASLMEEYFHLALDHPPSEVRVYDSSSRRTRNGGIEQALDPEI